MRVSNERHGHVAGATMPVRARQRLAPQPTWHTLEQRDCTGPSSTSTRLRQQPRDDDSTTYESDLGDSMATPEC